MPLVEKKRLVFWQNIPSIHQAPLVRSLAERFAEDVVFVAERNISSRRQSQGWEKPEFVPARLVISPSQSERGRLLDAKPQRSVHIFGGLHVEPKTYATLRASVRKGLDVGVFAEPGRRDGVKGALRRLRYIGHALRWNRHLAFLLATGRLGVEWYRDCGFSDGILHPFAYFVDPVSGPISSGSDPSSAVRFLFVGQLVEHKGVDLLLHALAQLESDGWRLEVVGKGPWIECLSKLASKLGVARHIQWHGTLPNAQVRILMGRADCLVLPSRHDGWGVVVNEALLVGTPAIVSDAAGASDLIQGERVGQVFRSESAEDLTDALREKVKRNPVGPSERRRLREWAEEHISPAAGAEYLVSVLRFAFGGRDMRPVPPWRQPKAIEQIIGASQTLRRS